MKTFSLIAHCQFQFQKASLRALVEMGCDGSLPSFIYLFIYLFIIFNPVSLQHLRVAGLGLPTPSCGPLPGLLRLLAAGLHHPRGQDECPGRHHGPAAAAGERPDPKARKGMGLSGHVGSPASWVGELCV